MAFAIASGVSPQAGIYCAIVAGFLISALGGSRVQIGGPTGAFVVVVAGIVGEYGIDGLFMCTLMAGVILMILGLSGFGLAVKYIPRPVVIGFTNGIAILIASTQIKDFFGLEIQDVPSDFIGRMSELAIHFHSLSPTVTAVSVISLVLIVFIRRNYPKIPGTIVALVLATAIAWTMGLPLETIQTRFGGIPSGIPSISIPTFRPDLLLTLLSPAITIALLGAIESLLSAVVADRMSGDKHNPNVELFAQGVANIFSPLAGGLPATGAIARTATNIRSGAKTPVAGIVHAVTLLLVLLYGAPLANQIPLCVLAAILMVVSYNMGEWAEILEILKLSKSDICVWIITLVLTVFADLTVAVEAGMILAALLYIRNVTLTTTVSEVTPEYVESGINHSLQCNEIPKDVSVFRIHGPFLFGASDKISALEDRIDSLPKIVILRLRNMTAIDATGLNALENFAEKVRESGRHLILCGMRDQPARIMQQSQFHLLVGDGNLQPSLRDAIKRSEDLLSNPQESALHNQEGS